MPIDQHTVVRTLLNDRLKLCAYIVTLVRDEHLAEDVFQEVAMLALDRREQIRNAAALSAWLRTTARHRAFHAIEKQAKQPLRLDDATLELLDPHWRELDHTRSADVRDALQQCLAKLSPRSRRIIELRYARNLKSGQIATKLQRTAHSVYVALNRIHRSLADCLHRQLEQEARR